MPSLLREAPISYQFDRNVITVDTGTPKQKPAAIMRKRLGSRDVGLEIWIKPETRIGSYWDESIGQYQSIGGTLR